MRKPLTANLPARAGTAPEWCSRLGSAGDIRSVVAAPASDLVDSLLDHDVRSKADCVCSDIPPGSLISASTGSNPLRVAGARAPEA